MEHAVESCVWAAQGYVVYAPNPRGSTGFGQKYTDEISGDWGGKCYRDLMAGLDYVRSNRSSIVIDWRQLVLRLVAT